MADRSFFQFQNHYLTLQGLYCRMVICAFSLFMLLGNFLRLVPLPPFPSHLSIAEVFFYALCIPYYFATFRKSHFIVLVIVLSTLYGAIVNGFSLPASFYALKLIAMIGAAHTLAWAFSQMKNPLDYLLNLFVTLCILGFFIFILFPKAHIFFALLKGLGIEFLGDPHQRRFISPFFDPNYWAAISPLGLILAFFGKRPLVFGLILLSVLLTFSRSGIGALILLLPILWALHRGVHLSSILIWFPLAFVPFVFKGPFSHLVDRSRDLALDPSALARWDTFLAAWEIFKESPFFGMGYHYSSPIFFELTGRYSFDSSLMVTLVSFGLILTCSFLFLTWKWSQSLLKRACPISYCLVYYLWLSLLFTSLFNNLIYYQYWFIPTLALLIFAKRREGRLLNLFE